MILSVSACFQTIDMTGSINIYVNKRDKHARIITSQNILLLKMTDVEASL